MNTKTPIPKFIDDVYSKGIVRPKWYVPQHGFQIEGVCRQLFCEAMNERVIFSPGLDIRNLDLVRAKPIGLCPNCSSLFQSERLGVFYCTVFIDVRMRNSNEVLHIPEKEFKSLAWLDIDIGSEITFDALAISIVPLEKEALHLMISCPIQEEQDIPRKSVPPRAPRIKLANNSLTTGDNWDCFLSHTWGLNNQTHIRVGDIKVHLEIEGLTVWYDSGIINNFIDKQILSGLDNSKCFIAFITEDYLRATNDENNIAGQEFRYAANQDVTSIVPVVLDSRFVNPVNWPSCVAKLKLGSKLCLDFSTAEKEEHHTPHLIQRIRQIV